MPYMDSWDRFDKWRMYYYVPDSTFGYYETSAPTLLGILKKLIQARKIYKKIKAVSIRRKPTCKCCKLHHTERW